MRLRYLVPILLASGCSLDLDFTSEATSIHAVAAGDGETAVDICAGPTGLLTCNNEEDFVITLDGKQALTEQPWFSFGGLKASVDADAGLLTVTRARDGAAATVTLPDRFTVDGPAPNAVVSREAGVSLRWSPSGSADPVRWTVTTRCAEKESRTEGEGEKDDGMLFIKASRLPQVERQGCPVTLSLLRERQGSVGPGYAQGSTIVAAQERRLIFTLTP